MKSSAVEGLLSAVGLTHTPIRAAVVAGHCLVLVERKLTTVIHWMDQWQYAALKGNPYFLPLIVYWMYFFNGYVMVVIGFYDPFPASLKG